MNLDQPQDIPAPAPNRRWDWLVLVLTVAIALGALAYDTFQRLPAFDDEGLVLAAVQNYKEGLVPYRQFDTQYGPAVLELYARLGFPGAGPVTINHSRVLTCLLAGGILLVLAGQIARFTGRPLLAGLAAVLALTVLYERVYEPIHPNWGIALLTGAIALCLGRRGGWREIAAGVLAALLLFMKVNAGLLAVAAAGMVLLGNPPRSSWLFWVKLAAAALVLAAPFLLMGPLFGTDPYYLPQAISATLLILLVLLATGSFREGLQPDLRGLVKFSAGLMLTSAAALAYFIGGRGLTPAELWYGLLTQHNDFASSRFVPLGSTGSGGLIILALGGLIGLWAARKRGARPAWIVLALGGVAAGLAYFMGNLQLLMTLPLVPLLYLLRREGEPAPPHAPWLAATLWIGVLFQLYAFPVAGSQLNFALLLALPAVVAALPLVPLPARIRDWRYLSAAGSVALVAGALFFFWHGQAAYESQTAVRELAGGSGVRVRPAEAAKLNGVLLNLNDPDFPNPLLMPYSARLPLTAGRFPMTRRGRTNWPFVYDAARQRALLEELQPYRPIHFLENPELMKFWGRGQRSSFGLQPGPMLDLFQNTPVYARAGDWVFRGNTAILKRWWGFSTQGGCRENCPLYLRLPGQRRINRLSLLDAGSGLRLDPLSRECTLQGRRLGAYPFTLEGAQPLRIQLAPEEQRAVAPQSLILLVFEEGEDAPWPLALSEVTPELLPAVTPTR
jgi:hypothetical protein